MKRIHFNVGNSKIACQIEPPPASYSRTTVPTEVTCVCCKSYAKGYLKVGDFCQVTINKQRRRALNRTGNPHA